ncbi:hypothetical protein [Levilactobacillus bambusae]|nr:hypothetical protein [Levilactobacillus bambusae]
MKVNKLAAYLSIIATLITIVLNIMSVSQRMKSLHQESASKPKR